MTRKEIEDIARRHGVHEEFINGKTKEELVHKIDKWFSSLLGHAILNGSGKAVEEEYIQKRDALRKELGIEIV